jgi:hypothetical protein
LKEGKPHWQLDFQMWEVQIFDVRLQITMGWNRILSGLLAVIYIITGLAGGGAEGAFVTFGFVILPLACIWFGDAMGGYTGLTTSMAITSPSPGLMVCIAGWVFLLAPIIAGLLALIT